MCVVVMFMGFRERLAGVVTGVLLSVSANVPIVALVSLSLSLLFASAMVVEIRDWELWCVGLFLCVGLWFWGLRYFCEFV